MNRRAFLTAMGGSTVAVPLVVEAQSPRQRHRVGLLNGAAPGIEAVLRESLRALGYVEGTNLVIDARAARGRVETLPTDA
jgi:hypothetical protein